MPSSIFRVLAVTLLLTIIMGAITILAQSNTPPPFTVVSIGASPPLTSPGVSKVTITLLYTGGTYLYGTNFYLTPCPGTATPISVVSTNPVYVGWITPGEQVTVTYLVNTTVPLRCQSYLKITWGAQYEQSPMAQVTTYVQVAGPGSVSMDFPLVINGEPSISVATNTTYVVSNLASPVNIIISNNGSGPIYNLEVGIEAQGATLVPSSSTVVIGTLNPGRSYVLSIYVLPTIGGGSVSLTITYSGIDQGGNTVSGTYTTSMSVVPASPNQVIIYPVNSSLRVGVGELVIGIRNVNPIPIYNVTLVLTSTSGLTLMGNTTYTVGEVVPGSTYYLEIPVAVPLTSSSASITYSLSYQYVNGYPEGSGGSITLSIANEPSITMTSYQVAPSVITVGSPVSVSITFVNTGPVPAYNLNITAIPGPGLTVLSQQSTYLGTLDPQQLSAAAFSFTVTEPVNTTVTFLIS
ncbi:MAG: COG1361 S-layer family protein, partial [Vulcanisaeta sp.]